MEFKERFYELVGNQSEMMRDILLILTAPVIYFQFIPALLIDFTVSLYQQICFPVYGLEKVNRSDYIKFDRHYLKHLSGVKKLNCLYCSYFNGVISYVREVAARTEVYWCPLKNLARKSPHKYYKNFASRDNPTEFNEKYNQSKL
ncbi:hypothetical protein [Bacteriovorax sp. DB6_IX]|uniref:hypothetical protein n=1 Tax=Bacteriovorax sp. DB6_IX TaxID=1353530 RepID=UPI00038A5570|nr:hypothetical protein [Bacteriovorax sp. DB6_IX]EQC51848.1 hypothetical protein M901_2696 [Bacteriovorax sp. DB6_IX]